MCGHGIGTVQWLDTERRKGSKAKWFPKDTQTNHYCFPTHQVNASFASQFPTHSSFQFLNIIFIISLTILLPTPHSHSIYIYTFNFQFIFPSSHFSLLITTYYFHFATSMLSNAFHFNDLFGCTIQNPICYMQLLKDN